MEFSLAWLDSLQICYIDSLYHTHQYVGVLSWYIIKLFSFSGVLLLFLLRKIWRGKMSRFLIKSSFLWSSHQNLFKFASWIHCIILISMLVFTSWYILSFSSFFWCFYCDCSYLEKYALGKCYGFWLTHVSYEVLIRISSNLIHRFIVSCPTTWGKLLVDIFYNICIFSVFSVFLLRKICSGNMIIFHHNFVFLCCYNF